MKDYCMLMNVLYDFDYLIILGWFFHTHLGHCENKILMGIYFEFYWSILHLQWNFSFSIGLQFIRQIFHLYDGNLLAWGDPSSKLNQFLHAEQGYQCKFLRIIKVYVLQLQGFKPNRTVFQGLVLYLNLAVYRIWYFFQQTNYHHNTKHHNLPLPVSQHKYKVLLQNQQYFLLQMPYITPIILITSLSNNDDDSESILLCHEMPHLHQLTFSIK